jgi:hypothetical protein
VTSPGRAAAASFAGAVMDWYDFFVYGLVAALTFPHLFREAANREMINLAESSDSPYL